MLWESQVSRYSFCWEVGGLSPPEAPPNVAGASDADKKYKARGPTREGDYSPRSFPARGRPTHRRCGSPSAVKTAHTVRKRSAPNLELGFSRQLSAPACCRLAQSLIKTHGIEQECQKNRVIEGTKKRTSLCKTSVIVAFGWVALLSHTRPPGANLDLSRAPENNLGKSKQADSYQPIYKKNGTPHRILCRGRSREILRSVHAVYFNPVGKIMGRLPSVIVTHATAPYISIPNRLSMYGFPCPFLPASWGH